MKILFLRGWLSKPGGVKATFLASHGHQVVNPTLPDEDFDEAVRHLRKHDVKFRIEPMDCPSCRMAMVFDPDGNTICIHKRHAK